MGKWKLKSITATDNDRDSADEFGTNFRVTLKLAYAPSVFTRAFKETVLKESPVMKESPVLVWDETITTLEHHTNNYWTFATNMFLHKPGSNSFDAWSRRYIAAYGFVTNTPVFLKRGTVKFYDKKGRPVSPDEFAGKPAEADEEKAAIIREYLGKHGGVFVIEIHDVPSIKTNLPKHVERRVLFECGLEGDNQRVKAMQYLNVDTNQPPDTWERVFEISTSTSPSFSRNDPPTQGLNLVPPPDRVSTPDQTLSLGMSW